MPRSQLLRTERSKHLIRRLLVLYVEHLDVFSVYSGKKFFQDRNSHDKKVMGADAQQRCLQFSPEAFTCQLEGAYFIDDAHIGVLGTFYDLLGQVQDLWDEIKWPDSIPVLFP